MANSSPAHRVYIIMGVSGSGKSAVAKELLRRIDDAAFLDGDFLHPRHNILKMAEGHPLNDEDRAPWLDLINAAAFAMQRTNRISFIVCSALKKSYRKKIHQGNEDNLQFIHLHGDYDVIENRLKARKGHFFKPEMLQSQFATLELPTPDENVISIDVDTTLDGVVEAILKAIGEAK